MENKSGSETNSRAIIAERVLALYEGEYPQKAIIIWDAGSIREYTHREEVVWERTVMISSLVNGERMKTEDRTSALAYLSELFILDFVRNSIVPVFKSTYDQEVRAFLTPFALDKSRKTRRGADICIGRVIKVNGEELIVPIFMIDVTMAGEMALKELFKYGSGINMSSPVIVMPIGHIKFQYSDVGEISYGDWIYHYFIEDLMVIKDISRIGDLYPEGLFYGLLLQIKRSILSGWEDLSEISSSTRQFETHLQQRIVSSMGTLIEVGSALGIDMSSYELPIVNRNGNGFALGDRTRPRRMQPWHRAVQRRLTQNQIDIGVQDYNQ